MVSYDNFLTKEEAEHIIEFIEKSDSIKDKKSNRNLEFCHVPNYTSFKFLEEKLNSINIINKPSFNINKYEKGYYFLPHVDKGGPNDPNKQRVRTIIINLSNPNSYSGGELYINNQLISSKQGLAISFDSSTIHEVKKITRGFRYSVVIWLKKNNIKTSTI